MAASDTTDTSSHLSNGEQMDCLSASELDHRIQEEINRAERQGTPLCCLLVTIGNVEELSREHGGELSERALAYVGSALRRQLRDFDRIGRPSDRELLVVLPGADSPRGEAVARRVLLRLMADRGLALLDGGTVVILIEERGELRMGACRGEQAASLRIAPVEGTALGALYRAREPLALDRPRGQEAAWLHELGLQARSALVEPLTMEEHGGGLVIAVRTDGGFRRHDRESLQAFAASVAQRLAAERSVEIERIRYGIQARERERTRWAREIHDESIQGMGALRMKLASARDLDDPTARKDSVEAVREGVGHETRGLRHPS